MYGGSADGLARGWSWTPADARAGRSNGASGNGHADIADPTRGAARCAAGMTRGPDGVRQGSSGPDLHVDKMPAYNLADVIAELGTLCRNQLRIGNSQHTIPRLTNTNDIQAKTLALLDAKLGA